MSDLSKEELEIIKANPFGGGLDAFRNSVKSNYVDRGVVDQDEMIRRLILSGASDTRECYTIHPL
jgi:hypothetical protein